MQDKKKTKAQLLEELDQLRNQISTLQTQLERRQQAEADHRQITDNLPVLIFTASVDGYYQEVNPAFEKSLGWSEQESLSRPFIKFIHPDDQTAAIEVFEELKSCPVATFFMGRYIRKDGDLPWISWTMIPLPGRDIVYGIGTDITELKRAAVNWQQASEFNERLIASMSDGLSVLDTECVHVEVNNAFCRMTGFDRDELLGVGPPHPYWPPEDCDRIQQFLDEVTRGEIRQFELTFMRKNGERFPVLVAASQAKNQDGVIVNHFATVKDLSALKEIKHRLQESERRLSTLMSNLPGIVFRCQNDPSWPMEFLSRGTLALTGYPASKFTGSRAEAFRDIIHPEDRDLLWNRIQAALGQRRRYQVEYRIHTASGDERWVWEQGCGVYAEDGQLAALEGFITDITAQKNAELELRKTRAELAQRVEERTVELTRANAELRVFKSFSEASGEGFGMTDMAGRIVYVNPALARLVGEDNPQNMHGRHPSVFYTGNYRALQGTEVFPVLERDGVWRGELTMMSLTGEEVPVLQTSFTLVDDDGEPIRRGVVVTDLRRIKEAQSALQESLAELQAIYDGMIDGLSICDMDSRETLRTNPAFSHMLGYTEDELRALSMEEAFPPEDLPWILERIEAHAEGQATRSKNIPLIRQDGSILYSDVSSTPIRYQGRRCMLTFFHDITDRKESQQRLYRMLQASDRERELITYDIHDGVAQQLLGAKMYFEAVLQLDGGVSPAAMSTFEKGVAALRQASAEARSLIDRTRTPVLRRFGVQAAIADFIDQFFDTKGTPEFIYHCEARFGRLEPVLENAIFRVAQEAITNACKHSGGKTVRVSMIQADDDLIIKVQDDGKGFDGSKVKENRFGLHGIRERVRLLGKNLIIESRPGSGTRIEATFPSISRKETEN